MIYFEPIQFLLVSIIITLFFFYFKSLSSVLLDRLIVLILFSIGIYSVVFPDTVTIIANMLGVGRGTDLTLYFFIIMSFFVWLILHNRIKAQKIKLTQLTRAIAIQQAQTFHLNKDPHD